MANLMCNGNQLQNVRFLKANWQSILIKWGQELVLLRLGETNWNNQLNNNPKNCFKINNDWVKPEETLPAQLVSSRKQRFFH